MKFVTKELEHKILRSWTVRRRLSKLGRDITRDAAIKTPVRTGMLQSNWYSTVMPSKEHVQVLLIGDRMNYGAYVELGTRYFQGREMLKKSLKKHGVVGESPTMIYTALARAARRP